MPVLKPKLYLETTIPSYLTAWPSRDLIRAGHQQITREWWENRRRAFEIYISQFVISEAAAGDPAAARERLKIIQSFPLLEATEEAKELASDLVNSLALPQKSVIDAAHISVAAAHEMQFLLTWNCAHIGNAEMAASIARVCQEHGFHPPVICTPIELMGI